MEQGRKHAFISLWIVCLLFLVFLSKATAQEIAIGIKVGDSFSYAVNAFFESTDPNGQPSSWFLPLLEWGSVSNEITNIMGNTVTTKNTIYRKNGTHETHSSTFEITGLGNIIPADLSQGDILVPYPPTCWINETLPRTYPDSVRDTNHLSIIGPYQVEYQVEIPDVSYDFYWDRATGVLVELTVSHENETAGYVTSWSISQQIIATNLWTAEAIHISSPENRTYTIEEIPLTFVAVARESTQWIGYSLDSQANVTIAGNTTLSGLSVGSHNLVVYARDLAGNTGASEGIYFIVETADVMPFPFEWLMIGIIVVVALAGTVGFVLYRRRKAPAEQLSSL